MGNFAENLNLGNRVRPPLGVNMWKLFALQMYPDCTDASQILDLILIWVKEQIL